MATSRLCSIPNCGKQAQTRGWCPAHYWHWRKYGTPLSGRHRSTSNGEPKHFLDTVVFPASTEECIFWPFGRSSGYGVIHIDGVPRTVHRLVCERLFGPAPTPDHVGAHSCGRGKEGCVNPRHLRWATPTENANDKRAHGKHLQGSRIGNSKLSEADVLTIKSMKGRVSGAALARQYGVDKAHISAILRGKVWGWLSSP